MTTENTTEQNRQTLAAELHSLLPSLCRLTDLAIEIGITEEGQRQVAEKLSPVRVVGVRDDFYRAIEVIGLIISRNIKWQRTEFSIARDSRSIASVLVADTQYGTQRFLVDFGADEGRVIELIGNGEDRLPSYILGESLIEILETIQREGGHVFLSSDLIKQADRRAQSQKSATPPADESASDSVAAAIERAREQQRIDDEEEKAGLLRIYGEFVRKQGNLDADEMNTLAGVMIDLGFGHSRYAADVEVVKKAHHLQSVDSPAVLAEAKNEMEAAKLKCSELEKLERDLPRRQAEARSEFMRAAARFRESGSASRGIATLKNAHPHLFTGEESSERSGNAEPTSPPASEREESSDRENTEPADLLAAIAGR